MLVLMCVRPGGALREDLSPQRLAHFPSAFCYAPAKSAPGLRSPECQLHSKSQDVEAVRLRLSVRMILPGWAGPAEASVPLQLRRPAGRLARTGPLRMSEDATEKKSPEDIKELNMKLWDASEAGDAELIRQLVDEGAEVNSAPFVDDEDDDDDSADFSTSTATSELSNEGSAPEASVAVDGTLEKIEKPKACSSLLVRALPAS